MATTMPDERPGNLLIVATPIKNGLLSHNFYRGTHALQTPFNTTKGILTVSNMPVDKARNILVDQAKKAGAKYIFFLDDDVLPPPYAINRLLRLKAMVASGVYYSKSVPPLPVILKKDVIGGFEDWNYGDVIDVDYTGMGCVLIDMRVFDEISEPYFKYYKGSPEPNDGIGTLGEDVWFCEKVLEAGYKIYVDTLVQCKHEDFAKRTLYHYSKKHDCGVWHTPDNKIHYLLDAGKSVERAPASKAVKGKKVCWGYGIGKLEGYEETQIADPAKIRERYKDIESVKVKHLLEHRDNEDAFGFLRAIYKSMRGGADIEVFVPDVIEQVKNLTDETAGEIVESLLGPPQGKYKSIYNVETLEEYAERLGLAETKVIKRNGNLILSGVK